MSLCCKFCVKIVASTNAIANAKNCICICTCNSFDTEFATYESDQINLWGFEHDYGFHSIDKGFADTYIIAYGDIYNGLQAGAPEGACHDNVWKYFTKKLKSILKYISFLPSMNSMWWKDKRIFNILRLFH